MVRILAWACMAISAFVSSEAKTLHGGVTSGHRPTAAVFTPYHVSPGGGEKYLLSTVRSMQTMGCHVDILVQPDNVCQNQQCIMDVANSLRVTLDPSLFNVHVVHREDFKLYAGPYDLFFALGNEKYPPVEGVGKVNLYMCQFPFDLDRIVPQHGTHAFASYDAVLLNSNYSLRWYYAFSVLIFERLTGQNMLFPRMQVLHPPVTIAAPGHGLQHGPRVPHRNVVMVGRFFAGRQSKGHPQAVKIFAQLKEVLPTDTKLIMVGNPVPGHSAYMDDLRSLIENLDLSDRVEIVLAAPPERVTSILQSGLVQWHLTGLGVTDDPASLEHFGISIVEGMSNGCIPIAFTGGAADIIQPGLDGYMAVSAEEVLEYTKLVFAMGIHAQQVMQERCMVKSHAFEYEKFEQQFHHLVNTTGKLKPDSFLAKAFVSGLRS